MSDKIVITRSFKKIINQNDTGFKVLSFKIINNKSLFISFDTHKLKETSVETINALNKIKLSGSISIPEMNSTDASIQNILNDSVNYYISEYVNHHINLCSIENISMAKNKNLSIKFYITGGNIIELDLGSTTELNKDIEEDIEVEIVAISKLSAHMII